PGGRGIVAVPKRSGLWARLDRTPLGHGPACSRLPLGELFGNAFFFPRYLKKTVFIPPFQPKTLLDAASPAQKIGEAASLPWGGVLIVEAIKLLYLPVGARRIAAGATVPSASPVLVPEAAGASPAVAGPRAKSGAFCREAIAV